MGPDSEEHDGNLEDWVSAFGVAGLKLAALAVVRRGETSVGEACANIEAYTAGIMKVDERSMAEALASLEKGGYVERQDGRYRITAAGKRQMYLMLRQWNTYVDAMNNLWGCYYGT